MLLALGFEPTTFWLESSGIGCQSSLRLFYISPSNTGPGLVAASICGTWQLPATSQGGPWSTQIVYIQPRLRATTATLQASRLRGPNDSILGPPTVSFWNTWPYRNCFRLHREDRAEDDLHQFIHVLVSNGLRDLEQQFEVPAAGRQRADLLLRRIQQHLPRLLWSGKSF